MQTWRVHESCLEKEHATTLREKAHTKNTKNLKAAHAGAPNTKNYHTLTPAVSPVPPLFPLHSLQRLGDEGSHDAPDDQGTEDGDERGILDLVPRGLHLHAGLAQQRALPFPVGSRFGGREGGWSVGVCRWVHDLPRCPSTKPTYPYQPMSLITDQQQSNAPVLVRDAVEVLARLHALVNEGVEAALRAVHLCRVVEVWT